MNFKNYARYYNLLYQDKNYQAEADYVDALIKRHSSLSVKSILDIGCGTGKHAFILAEKGYNVTGVDLSEEMILEALKHKKSNTFFHTGNATDFDLNQNFDVVISLFHVASYQTSNSDLVSYFMNIKKHLKKNGLFIFDFWYGPAVYTDLPVARVKRLEDEKITVTRIAEPRFHENENIVDVNYEVIIEDKEHKQVERIRETHKMRFLFLPEIYLMLQAAGYDTENKDFFLHAEEWMTGVSPRKASWNAVCIGKNI